MKSESFRLCVPSLPTSSRVGQFSRRPVCPNPSKKATQVERGNDEIDRSPKADGRLSTLDGGEHQGEKRQLAVRPSGGFAAVAGSGQNSSETSISTARPAIMPANRSRPGIRLSGGPQPCTRVMIRTMAAWVPI
jgi:hypothetical protein